MTREKKKTATDAATPMTAIDGETVVEHLTNIIIPCLVNRGNDRKVVIRFDR